MSIYITISDSTTSSVANFVSTIDRLNEALNNCGNWANLIINLIEQLQSDSNYTTLISADKQSALTTCSTELSQAQAAILSALGVSP